MRCACGRKITQSEGSGKEKVWICEECGNRYQMVRGKARRV